MPITTLFILCSSPQVLQCAKLAYFLGTLAGTLLFLIFLDMCYRPLLVGVLCYAVIPRSISTCLSASIATIALAKSVGAAIAAACAGGVTP